MSQGQSLSDHGRERLSEGGSRSLTANEEGCLEIGSRSWSFTEEGCLIKAVVLETSN